MKFIFFGAGYCSRFIIPYLPKTWEIICTHKNKVIQQKEDKNSNLIRMYFKDFLSNKKVLMDNVSFILNSIPPSKNGDIVLKNLTNLIKTNKKTLKWYGYFSSTSVYGNHNGNWVDENSSLNPTNKRGQLRLEAEENHLKLFEKNRLPIHIFRLPGIYGPGRSVFDKVSNSEIIEIKKKNHFFSRIHVEDIASAIHNSLQQKTPGEIFNITDDLPSESSDIVKYAASLLKIKNIKKINFDDPQLNEKTKSFYLDNKKVSNRKIKKILGWTPKYRNYKLGLKSIFKLIS
jgi:nucleoside-diphosphate-sugar epimerase|tara:strand:+ start:710 stop:1573 length:864 start_codon:yes stop_codon:yes gene_type:complete